MEEKLFTTEEQTTILTFQPDDPGKFEILNRRRELLGVPSVEQQQGRANAERAQIATEREQVNAEIKRLTELGRGAVEPSEIEGPGVNGEFQPGGEPPPANPYSPAANNFMRILQNNPVNANTILQRAMSVPPSLALADIMSRLSVQGTSTEQIQQEAEALQEEAAARGEAETPAQAASAAAPMTLQGAVGASNPQPDDGEDVDPDVEALGQQVEASAGQRELADTADALAVVRIQTELAGITGDHELPSALSSYHQLTRLGIERQEALDSITDQSLREAVRDRTSNRINP
jgi:hypothetical protein